MHCSLGIELNEDCNVADMDSVSLASRNIVCSELTVTERELLQFRCALPSDFFEEERAICTYHKKTCLITYEPRQIKCCDPYKKHKGVISKSLFSIPLEWCKWKPDLIPGQKLCISCKVRTCQAINAIKQLSSSEPEEEPQEDLTAESPITARYSLNTSLCLMDISPCNLHGIRPSAKKALAQRKFAAAKRGLKRKISAAIKVEMPESSTDEESSNRELVNLKLKCYDDMLANMKSALHNPDFTRAEKIRLLTVSPRDHVLGCRAASRSFGVTESMIRDARKQASRVGMYTKPRPRIGKFLDHDTVAKVIEFYQSDEYSRIMPGKKDCVKVRGSNIPKQKRLMLCNLKELHHEFKQKYPGNRVGFSKFSTLRPKWCVLAGAPGTHCVCVCTIHQNPLLLLQATH